MSAWVLTQLTPLENHKPAIYSVSSGTEKLNKFLKEYKKIIKSNFSYMFNNNTYTDFRTAYTHFLIPRYVTKYLSDFTEPK